MKVKDLYKRIASLAPEQRALLSRRLEGHDEVALPGEGPEPPIQHSADGEILAPLSLMQERLWVLDEMEPGNLAFSLPIMSYAIEGKFYRRAMERAFTLLEERHDSLRTTFRNIDGTGYQVIHPPRQRVPMPIIDFAALDDDTSYATWMKIAERAGRIPFDLRNGPVWRCFLFRAAPDQHVLIILMHHIISDGWSMGVMYKDLTAAYGALSTSASADGSEVSLPPLRFQYREFARWQRERFRGERLQKELDFWRQEVAGAPMVLELPTDRPRPAKQTFVGFRETRRFPGALIDKIHQRMSAENATNFIFMLAVWNLLLFRHSGRRELLTGSPMAGRKLPGTEDLIGFFVNTLVFRASLHPRMSFSELVQQLRNRVMQVYEHHEMPFHVLVKELQPHRDPSYPPLVQAMFTVQNIPTPNLELGDSRVTSRHVQNHASQVDVILFIGEDEDKRVSYAHLEYNTDLFDQVSMIRWFRQYELLAEAVADAPDTALADFELLPPSQRHQLLVEWGHERRLQPRARLLHQLGTPWAEHTPDAVAVVLGDPGGSASAVLTYGELYRRAGRLAHLLQTRDLGAEDLVGVYLDRRLHVPVALLGVLHAGAAYLPLDPTHPHGRLELLLRDAGVKLLITERSRQDDLQLPEGLEILCLDAPEVEQQLNSATSPLPATPPPCRADPANLAYLIYTSGSTGKPKGVLIQHQHVTRMLRAVEEWFDFSAADAWSVFHSFAFDFTVWELWGALAFGGRAVIVPYKVSRSPEAFYALIRNTRITVINQTPSAFRQLIPAEASVDPSGRTPLRHVMIGGEALELQTLRPWIARHPVRPRLYNIYGITETTVFLTRRPLRTREITAGGVGLLGWPMVDVPQYVVDPFLRLSPAGIPGELCVGGPSNARGYQGQPAMTAGRFVPDPFTPTWRSPSVGGDGRRLFSTGAAGERMYRSGDLVRRCHDGDLEYLGRIDHQVQLRGFRVELGEIEAQLNRHPAVLESIVQVRGQGERERLVAYLVLAHASDGSKSDLDVEALQSFLSETLPYYMVPASFVVLDVLPLNANGKVDRAALPDPDTAEGLQRQNYVAPRSPAETEMAAIWGKALGLEQVSVEANFFELGGHSLLATQVTAQIRKAFEVDLPLRALFDDPTIARLVERMHEGEDTSMPPLRRYPRPEPLPASFAQRRLWFLDRLMPGNAFYLVPEAWQLRGPLEVSRLAQAFRLVVERHEVLRTVFPEIDGEPAQDVLPVPKLWPLPAIDLSRLRHDHGDTEAERLATLEPTRPLSLTRDLPIRTFLLRQAPWMHTLLITQHHIVTDGWSIGVLHEDLDVAYRFLGGSLPKDKSKALRPLDLQYADFTLWQRDWLSGRALDEQLDWWRERLTTEEGRPVPTLELPTDRPRPPMQRFRGAYLTAEIPGPVRDRIDELARRHNGTMFMALVSGFAVLLSRYSGQTDLLIGSPIAGRDHQELDELIGFFVNTLALRCRLEGDPSFEELLDRVREKALGAFKHQDIPFEKLVEELAPERDLSRNPLFQVSLAYQNTPEAGSHLGPLEIDTLKVTLDTTRFDLEMHVRQERDGRFNADLFFASDIFDASTAGRMVRQFARLLERAAATPDVPITHLSMLSDAEIHQLHREWNHASLRGTDPLARQHVALSFQTQLETQPNAIAVVEDRGDGPHLHLSYDQLARRAGWLANAIRRRAGELGVRLGPDVPVGVCLPRGPELIATLLAVVETGAAYLPLDPDYPAARLAHMVEDSAAPLVIRRTSADTAQLPTIWPLLDLDDVLATAAPAPAHALPAAPPAFTDPDQLLYVMYTSGSTGRPKGTSIPHRAVQRLVRHAGFVPLDASDRLAQVANASFDAATFEIWGALLNGGCVVVLPKDTVLLSERLTTALAAQRVSAMFLTCALFNQIASQAPERLSGVRNLLVGGEALDPASIRRVLESGSPPQRLLNGYGPTENTTFSVVEHITRVPEHAATVPIGRPLDRSGAHVVGRRGSLLPLGAAGELWVSGDGLARGYHQRPGLTADRFAPHPLAGHGAVPAGARAYRTGDLARYLADGRVDCLGRIDRQVKIRGFRIELGEIETALNELPQVAQGAVAVHDDGTGAGNKRLVAYLVPREHADTDDLEVSTLRAALQKRLPDYMVPALFMLLDTMPLTANGKLDRQALPAPSEEGALLSQAYVAPATPLEAQLVEIWEQVLRLPRISVKDDFFDLGGHSLLATQLAARIRRLLDVELPLQDLFEAPTVRQLAPRVEAAGRRSRPPLTAWPRPLPETVPASFAQQRMWFLDRLTPDNPFYLVPLAWELRGELAPKRLAAALTALVERHEVLRTEFPAVGGEPAQRVRPPHRCELPAIDLSGLPASVAECEIARLSEREALRPLALLDAPPLRTCLLRLHDERHTLLLTQHHIATDGWSVGILSRDLGALYEGHTLPPLAVQYADFALWQRSWLQGAALEQQISWWRRTLTVDGHQLPRQMELPTDRPRPPIPRFRGAHLGFHIGADLHETLRRLGQSEGGATPFMVLLAGFGATLGRLAGQDDLILGSPIAGRDQAELEELIGFFVNTLSLRCRLRANDGSALSFRQLVRQLRETALGAYSHQDLPFEKLVEELAPERDLSRNPLFQVSFALQNAPTAGSQLTTGLQLHSLPVELHSTHFDLEIHLQNSPEGALMGSVAYDADLFDHTTINRLLRDYLRLLIAVGVQPEEPLSRLPWFDAAQRHQLCLEWAQSPPLADDADQEQSVGVRFRLQADRAPDAIAIVENRDEAGGDLHLSYRELDRRARHVAHALRQRATEASVALGADVAVGVCLPRSADLLAAFLGVVETGAAYLPLDPDYPAARLADMVGDSCMALALHRGAAGGAQLPAVLPALDLDTVLGAGRAAPTPAPPRRELTSSADDLLYIMYTSGSTGRPKGTGIPHRAVRRLVRHASFAPLGPDDRLAQVANASFDAATLEIWGALLNGGCVVVIPRETVLASEELVRTLGAQRITTMFLTCSLFNQISAREPGSLSGLKHLLVGGEALDPASIRRVLESGSPPLRLLNGYGPTENTTFSVVEHITHVPTDARSVPIGRPLSRSSAYVLDPRFFSLRPVGAIGELCVGGDGVARGYHRRPGLTADRFIPHPFAGQLGPDGQPVAAGARLYRTGDLARVLADGRIDCLGRIDRQVKIRGFRIEPGEVEAALSELPQIAQGAVLVLDDPAASAAQGKKVKRLVAYFVPADDAAEDDLTVSALRLGLQGTLPDYMTPSAFVRLERMPLTPNGKLDHKALPAPEEGELAAVGATYVAPTGVLQKQVAEVWQLVLGVEQTGIHDNFFDLGGTSLLMARLQSRLQDILGRPLTIVKLFEHPTIHSLCQYLQSLDGDNGAAQPRESVQEVRRGVDERRQQRQQQRQKQRERMRRLQGGGPDGGTRPRFGPGNRS